MWLLLPDPAGRFASARGGVLFRSLVVPLPSCPLSSSTSSSRTLRAFRLSLFFSLSPLLKAACLPSPLLFFFPCAGRLFHLSTMSSFTTKIQRTANAPTTAPDETEQTVAQAILDLENNVPELKAELRALQISAAKEVDVKGGKKAIIIFVPVPQLKAFHKVQQRSAQQSLPCLSRLAV